jgi:hypothetical protein
MDPNVLSLLHFVVPGLIVVSIFLVITLAIGGDKPPSAPPPEPPPALTPEDMLRAENRELRRRLTIVEKRDF